MAYGAAQGLDTVLYLTVGTGIGGGALVGGRVLHGLVHPEMGHVRVPHDIARGSVSGRVSVITATASRAWPAVPPWPRAGAGPPDELPPDHPAWALEARYLALALQGFVCTLSPQRIVIGGGVMAQPHLLPLVRQALAALLNGYIQAPESWTTSRAMSWRLRWAVAQVCSAPWCWRRKPSIDSR